MPGRTEPEAVANFTKYLRESLSCVVSQDLAGFQQTEKLYKIWLSPPAEVKTLQGRRLYVSVTQIFTVGPDPKNAGQFKVSTREYSYRLSQDQELNSRGVLSYHWHPHDFAVRFPHLHVSVTPRVGYPEIERRIRRAHYPTSRVCIEDFILLLIDYYDVRPRMAISGWKKILKKNKGAFDKMATWK